MPKKLLVLMVLLMVSCTNALAQDVSSLVRAWQSQVQKSGGAANLQKQLESPGGAQKLQQDIQGEVKKQLPLEETINFAQLKKLLDNEPDAIAGVSANTTFGIARLKQLVADQERELQTVSDSITVREQLQRFKQMLDSYQMNNTDVSASMSLAQLKQLWSTQKQ